MNTGRTSADGREIHLLWTWDEEYVLVEVEACKNIANADIFTCPRFGSGVLGHSYFKTKFEAYFAAAEEIAAKRRDLEQKAINLSKSFYACQES